MSFIKNPTHTENIAVPTSPKVGLIIGYFPPVKHAQSIEAAHLALAYISDKRSLHTVSRHGSSIAQIKLSMKTRRKFQRARKQLMLRFEVSTETTVFGGMFTHPKLHTKTPYKKLLERIRWLQILWLILKEAPHLTYVKTRQDGPILRSLIFLAKWVKSSPIHILKTANAASKVSHILSIPDILEFDQKTALKKLRIHSLVPALPKAAPPPLFPHSNLTIYGLINSLTGLGENARMSHNCFRNLGVHPCLVNAETGKWHQKPNSIRKLKSPLVLHHLNADRINRNLDPTAYNIGFLLWELNSVPKEHLAALKSLDEIWVPSKFVARAYHKAINRPILNMKKGLQIPINISPNPNPNHFTCLNAFDFHSSVERKNPLAAAQAFQIAFPKRVYPECRLILKSTPSIKKHWGDPNNQMSKLRKIAFWDKRITLIENVYDTVTFHQLIADADVILSTHRAEGFGYIPSYGLAHGRPVITTDYGGSQDLCTNATSYPVEPNLVAVPKGHSILDASDALWADVSPDAIAKELRQIYYNREIAHIKAKIGQTQIRKEYSVSAHAKRYQKRLRNIGFL